MGLLFLCSLLLLFQALTYATGASYDYIVIGGGTSGLVVANRLSEDCNGKLAWLAT